jgi:hypothetical protein
MRWFKLCAILALVGTRTGFGAEVVVTVKNEQGRPIRNATLWVVPCDRHGAFLALPKQLQTDGKGQVKVNVDLHLPNDWETTHLLFKAEKGELQSLYKAYPLPSVHKSRTEFMRLILRPTVKVELQVKIVNERGQPVKAAYVFLWKVLGAGGLSPLIGVWKTSEAGQVLTSFRLPQNLINMSRFQNLPLQFFILAYHSSEGWASAVVNIKDLTNLNLSLLPHQRTELKVKDCFDEPIEGLRGRIAAIQIPNAPSIVPLPANLFAFATNPSGEVILRIPRDWKALWEWSPKVPWGLKATAKTIWLDANTSQTIQFHHKNIRVVGRLVDARTGKPLEGESVVLSVVNPTSCAPSLPFCSKTGKDGRFVIQTKPFLYAPTGIALGLPDGQRLLLWGSLKPPSFKPPLPPFQCQRWTVADVALNPPDARVFGVVVDGQGNPVPFAFVSSRSIKPQQLANNILVKAVGRACDGSRWEVSKQVTGENAFPFAYTFADHRGRFQLKLRSGVWKLSALKVGPPHRPPQKVSEFTTFLLPLGIGYIPSARNVKDVTLEIAKGAQVKVTLTVSGWAYF